MNKFLYAPLFLFAACSGTQSISDSSSHSPEIWNPQIARAQADRYEDSTQWNQAQFQQELPLAEFLRAYDLPLQLSPFPTPEYDSPGNGNAELSLTISGKKLTGQTITLAKGTGTESLFETIEGDEAHYFTILAISDESDAEQPVVASSRNHPNYLAQGSLNPTSKGRVDWVAVQMADGHSIAVVNGRIFDLSAGRIVLVAQKQDGSIRFRQLPEGAMTPTQMTDWQATISQETEVISFFGESGNL
ncbi:hypothetical protein [Pontibacter sp. G13]|uniref:hypothetical protein n=1 Tax=Pontibacter sp. G13 TaxID=3074898 RepID=UPI00288BD85A|nr:hypothetical protein [Pontibacter sp. G13]WNJ20307.1 hypothetical protein RJD25_07490 [Pontibacter sp. G13]